MNISGIIYDSVVDGEGLNTLLVSRYLHNVFFNWRDA